MSTTKASTSDAVLTTEQLATRDALHRLVDALHPTDLAEAARRLDELLAINDPHTQSLIAKWIRPDSVKTWPSDVVVAESYVPVYALIGDLPSAGGDLDQVARDYDVPREAVEAAVAYYRRHRAVIDQHFYTDELASEGIR